MSGTLKNHTLIVTEKPDAAKRIAQALDCRGKPKILKENGVPYFLALRDRILVVVPALGHLYTIVQEKGKKSTYPVFDFKWAPRHEVERKAKAIHKWIKTFSRLSNDAEEFISACDYDIEGCLIGYCILKFACGDKHSLAKRMKFSTLMKTELEQAYMQPLPHLNFAFIEAGRTRHEVDWLYGINLSRALTLAIHHSTGRYSTFSTGRIQGPTLHFLTTREMKIQSFVPTPYWKITAEAEILNCIVKADYEKKCIGTMVEADAVVQTCAGKTGKITKADTRIINQKSPVPFDLGSLQREAYSLFGFTPRRTLTITQRLYLDALISYPRTSSQKLPQIIDYRKILSSLKRKRKYTKLASKLLENEELKPREGAKDDPAHPAVYPTGNLPEKPLSVTERKIWDLIVRRFMAVFGESALKESIKARLEVNGHGFFLRGRRILKEGWIKYYTPYIRAEEVLLPPVKEGANVRLKQINREDRFTCPPPRYNPSSLLKKMEELGIGTKATRANIIQTLRNRGYIRNERIAVTELGFEVINILERYAPDVTSAQLTQELEKKMEKIQNNTIKRETIITEVIEKLKPQLNHFKENEEAIGETLSKATKRVQAQERVVGKCPNCGNGNLAIIYSRTTKKRFIGCTNYFKGLCVTSFPLPQLGAVKPSKNCCKACDWPQILVELRDRRPWNLCFNPDCSSKVKQRKKL